LEKLKKKDEIIEGLKEELNVRGNSSELQNELVDLEAMYTNGESSSRKHEDDMRIFP